MHFQRHRDGIRVFRIQIIQTRSYGFSFLPFPRVLVSVRGRNVIRLKHVMMTTTAARATISVCFRTRRGEVTDGRELV